MVCAVDAEAAPIRELLGGGTRGELDGIPARLLVTGMGKTNAAYALTVLLERELVRVVISFGIAGAYVGSGLGVGSIALASAAVYGDEGVQTPTGWMGTEGIGIPLLPDPEQPRFNVFPLDGAWVTAAERSLAAAGVAVRTGPFVTVSCCAGTAELGAERAHRFGGLCEDMESAALAHVCAHRDVPFLAVRGISNLVEDRDLHRWRIAEAAEAACGAVRVLVRSWEP
ncbi:MAG: Futalosine hydrolase [uncultured Gemmatimonadetes bacterium]|uniref:Futalosine hydrolase n=1 Tax=uncultured Gemmatimonadota bacterium TaxID=203437 RepID=A0A6J4MVS1_9BACT|nr:MAG: Futalosine hydrolase [uncultured Gemmatimonadota bacterium]